MDCAAPALLAQPIAAHGLNEETALKTNNATTTDWSPKEVRMIDHARFGHWNTETSIAALHSDRLDAPWEIYEAKNREMFEP